MQNPDYHKMFAPNFGFSSSQPQYVPEAEWDRGMRIRDFSGMTMGCSYCGKKFPNAVLMQHESACPERITGETDGIEGGNSQDRS